MFARYIQSAMAPDHYNQHDFVRFRRMDAHQDDDDFMALKYKPIIYRKAELLNTVASSPKMSVLKFSQNDGSMVGIYVPPNPITQDRNYFEITVQQKGERASTSICLASEQYLDVKSDDLLDEFAAYKCFRGGIVHCDGRSKGPLCKIGDRVGCGIKNYVRGDPRSKQRVVVFFTHNGKEVSRFFATFPSGLIFPAVVLSSEGECVYIHHDKTQYPKPEDTNNMCIDMISTCPGCRLEDWGRLSDVVLTTESYIAYNGYGRETTDIGMAQAFYPLNTTNHYFEVEIIDPGEHCYIAIALTERNYSLKKYPGWNRGSVAFHADDGKLFLGHGRGRQFGPVSGKGDIMGCGILFPRDYNYNFDMYPRKRRFQQLQGKEVASYPCGDEEELLELECYSSDQEQSDDSDQESFDDIYNDLNQQQPGNMVKVFFTRNGKTVGRCSVKLPAEGFYPTVGMLSCGEKVSVNLQPLTG